MHPILFHIGSFPVRSYGAMIVVGFLLGIWRVRRLCKRRMETEPEGSPRRIDPDAALDIGVMTLFSGLLGARLLFVLLDWKSFSGRPLEIFKIWEGGMSLHGSLILGVAYLVYAARRWKYSLLVLGDLAAPTFAICYILGRVGCFLNGCCYGNACDLPWGVRFPDEHTRGLLTPPSHPVQIYGSLFHVLFLWILTRVERRPRRDGQIFFLEVVLYGGYRGFVEFFRAGATSTYLAPNLPFTETHVISVVMIIAGIAGLVWTRKNRPLVQDTLFASPAPASV
jgi:phosphatidylglycerol:prolipoprotein diacylglycerol transferase